MKLEAELETHRNEGSKNSVGSILLIEDEAELLNILVELLTEQNYEVKGLLSANEALECLRHETYDILVSDLMMPEMDGIEVMHAAMEIDPDLVCIMMTGHGTIQSAVDAMRIGAFDYLLKPFRLNTITPILNRAMNTRRLRLEKVRRELEQQRLRLQTIVANVPGIVWETWHAQNGGPEKIDFASDYVEVMLGYTVEECLERNFWLSRVHSEDRDRVARESLETLNCGGQRRSEFRMTTKDKRTIWVEANYAVIKDNCGNSVGMRGVTTDITSRKHTEEQLRQAQKMEAIGQLAGGVAHDFNNLLTAINGYSELGLRRLKPGEPLRKNLEEIKKAGNRAASLTRQLLAFSRKQVLEPRVLGLNSIISDIEKMLRRLIGENIELKTELTESIGSIKADAGQIEQVLLNLVVNARDAMPEGGKVVIETATVLLCDEQAHVDLNPGTYVMLTVSDTGTGMNQETQAHIFEPFFTTKGKGRGTGLGLSMVYGIVQQSNGSISVESEEHQGTTFRVYFPVVVDEAIDNVDTQAKPEEIRGSETVLIVEDEDIVRNLATQILKIHGYAVLEAANGGAALKICEQHHGPIQLMLSDVVMPGMGGVELSNRLSSIRPDTKVLFMSGYTENVVLNNFIQKPFAHDELTRRIREVLDN